MAVAKSDASQAFLRDAAQVLALKCLIVRANGGADYAAISSVFLRRNLFTVSWNSIRRVAAMDYRKS